MVGKYCVVIIFDVYLVVVKGYPWTTLHILHHCAYIISLNIQYVAYGIKLKKFSFFPDFNISINSEIIPPLLHGGQIPETVDRS